MTVDELIDAWELAWSERDRTAFVPLCGPEFHYEDPTTGFPLLGPEELAEHALTLWRAFPDAHMERSGARLRSERFVAAPCKLVGTHLGDLGGLPPSGRALVVHVVFYCELSPHETLLRRVRGFFDLYEPAVELGILPRRGSLAERALLLVRGYGLRFGVRS